MKCTWPARKFHRLALGVRVGDKAKFRFGVYNQHVGIGNAKLWRWGSKPTPVPNANGFASQWNIGLKGV